MSRPSSPMLLAACCCLVLLAAPAAASRELTQSSQYDPIEVECKASEALCNKIKCEGVIRFSCDDSGNSKCVCESAGLASCFPGTASVTTRAGPKPLAQLQLGEEVLAVDAATGALQFSPVWMWSSRRPAEAAAFLRVRTDAGLNVTVTPSHYLFAWSGDGAAAAAAAALRSPGDWPYVLPRQVAVGDVVPVAAAGAGALQLARVTAVEEVQGTGVYMPHTLTGAIMVDGVVASELTSIVPHVLAGPRVQRGLAAGLRLALWALPTSAVEAAVRGVASWAHGVADAAISAQVLLGR